MQQRSPFGLPPSAVAAERASPAAQLHGAAYGLEVLGLPGEVWQLHYASVAMPTTKDIKGFGCIGRFVFRVAIADPEVVVKAVNDPFMDVKFMVCRVEYDSG